MMLLTYSFKYDAWHQNFLLAMENFDDEWKAALECRKSTTMMSGGRFLLDPSMVLKISNYFSQIYFKIYLPFFLYFVSFHHTTLPVLNQEFEWIFKPIRWECLSFTNPYSKSCIWLVQTFEKIHDSDFKIWIHFRKMEV